MIYGFIAILSLGALFVGKRYISVVYWLIFSVAFLFLSLRYGVGNDWYAYRELYEEIESSANFLEAAPNYDFMFKVIVLLCTQLEGGMFLLVFVCTVLQFILLHRLIEYFRPFALNPVFILFLSFTLFLFNFYIEWLRQSIAILAAMNALCLFFSRKYFQAIGLYVFAFFMHFSVLIYPLFLLLNRVISLKLWVILFIFSVVCIIFELELTRFGMENIARFVPYSVILERTSNYIHDPFFFTPITIGIGFFDRSLFFLLGLVWYKKVWKLNGAYTSDSTILLVFTNIFLLYPLIMNMFSDVSVVNERIRPIFQITYILFIPLLFKYFFGYLSRFLIIGYGLLVIFLQIWSGNSELTHVKYFPYWNRIFSDQDEISLMGRIREINELNRQIGYGTKDKQKEKEKLRE